MTILSRNNVAVTGHTGPVLLFSHGFGCDQGMWRSVADRFDGVARIVLFDHVGAGASDSACFDPERHADLGGYADDLIEVIEAVGLGPVVFIGHSVGASIGVIAAVRRPDLFQSLALVCGSPRYTDAEGYRGGFTPADIADLLALMDKNIAEWTTVVAPTILGPSAADGQADWSASVCRVDPDIARHFARTTFHADDRDAFAALALPTLLLDSRDDALAPTFVGDWMERHIPQARRVVLPTEGHCPHMTEPDLVEAALRRHLDLPPLDLAA